MPRKIAPKAERLRRIAKGVKADTLRMLEADRPSRFAGTITEIRGVLELAKEASKGERYKRIINKKATPRVKKKVKPVTKGKRIETRSDRESQEETLGPDYTVTRKRKK